MPASHEKSYFPRQMELVIERALADTPVVCLLGPRQCGKSTLAMHLASSRPYINLDDANTLKLAKRDPQGFVASLPDKVTIDEVQRIPELLLAIKQRVDKERQAGQFLLTGSANLLQLPRLADSLAGRMEIVELQPFSEAEKERTPATFLKKWLSHQIQPDFSTSSEMRPSDLPQRLLAGGYPEACKRPPKRARRWLLQYMRSLIERDIRDISQIKTGKDMQQFVEYLSYQNAQLLNITAIAKALGHTRATVEKYLSILENLYLIVRLPAWHKNSARRLIKAPKLHFRDSGLAAALSNTTEAMWMSDRSRFGRLLESFVIQQLKIQADLLDEQIRFFHYRDKDQKEVDCVLTRGPKVWGVEVKAATTIQNADSKGLLRLADQAGDDFKGGILFYDGVHTLPLEPARQIYAVPLEKLWKE